ncbi:MAG: undecaprenyl-diphosphate phosphatase [Acidobacteriota bacterium]
MSWAEALLLAVVQGLTEFLPISSSGHLAALQHYLSGFGAGDLAYDVLLHAGTLVSVLAYFRDDLARLARGLIGRGGEVGGSRRLLALLLVSTLVTTGVYLLFGGWIKASFESLTTIGVMFLVTGSILFSTRWGPAGALAAPAMRWRDAAGIGAAQGLALLPGISRSGSTIAAGLLLGLERDLAVRYSFLLSIPAILGALALIAAGEQRLVFDGGALGIYLSGAAVAALVGYGSIHVLLKVVRAGRLGLFAFYCWALGAGILLQQTLA